MIRNSSGPMMMMTTPLSSSSSPPPASTRTENDTSPENISSSSFTMRGVFVGSGSDGMSDPRVVNVIKSMAGPNAKHVLYLGTATYDLPNFAQRQTQHFFGGNYTVEKLDLVHCFPSPYEIEETIGRADIIVVGGGNTLYAVDRWKTLKYVIPALQKAKDRGCIMTGGSAGAICWFDGGHSNAMDPETYYAFRIQKFGIQGADYGDESSSQGEMDWKYIRVPGLGFLPGMVSPHLDRIQSNGVLRAYDFDRVLLQHPGETGIGIDHWAALAVDGDDYQVISLEDKPGSVLTMEDDSGRQVFSPEAKGVPGVWIKRVNIETGKVESTLLPPKGKLSNYLRPASYITHDEKAMAQCRLENPDVMRGRLTVQVARENASRGQVEPVRG